jgi:hypothetical protein
MAHPSEWVVVKYPDDGRRHTDPCEIVGRLPYDGDPDVAARYLTETGMSRGTALSLIFQVEAKRNSPKASDADAGYRPVA